MAGAASYTAVLDACVLYPAPIRDLLLSLARVGLYQARWSEEIQDEWIRNLLANRSDITPEKLNHTKRLMSENFPDAVINNYQKLIKSIELPDPNDRHVVAAAIKGHADVIVTFNLSDFPQHVLQEFDLEVQHPDDFIMNQFELHELAALGAVKAMRARLRNPPQTVDQLIETFESLQLAGTATYLRTAAQLI